MAISRLNKSLIKGIVTFGLCTVMSTGAFSSAKANSINNTENKATISTDTVNDGENENLTLKETKSGIIYGKNFTYENAPKIIKEEYELNCKSLGVTPESTDNIFIPQQKLSEYNILTTRSTDSISYLCTPDGTLNVSSLSAGNYSFNINNTVVGYSYITKGNPVHAWQALHNLYTYGNGGLIIPIDSLFGPITYNSVVSFQKRMNISQDGIVGRMTWVSLINRL